MDRMNPYGARTGSMSQFRPKGSKAYPLQGRGTLQDLPRSVVRPIPPAFDGPPHGLGRMRGKERQTTVRDDLMKSIRKSQQNVMPRGRGY